MKLIIAGSRTFLIKDAVRLIQREVSFQNIKGITQIVNGGCQKGVDYGAKLWAERNGYPIKYFNPQYTRYHHKEAPLIRNTEMADYADALLLIWDGYSRGSRDMLLKARIRKLNVFLYNDNNTEDTPIGIECSPGVQYDNGFFTEVLSGPRINSGSRS